MVLENLNDLILNIFSHNISTQYIHTIFSHNIYISTQYLYFHTIFIFLYILKNESIKLGFEEYRDIQSIDIKNILSKLYSDIILSFKIIHLLSNILVL